MEIGVFAMATETSARVSDKRATAGDRSPFKAVVIGAMLVVAAASAVAQILSGHIIPPEMGYLIGALIGAGVMALPWRWSMTIPLVLSVLLIIGSLTSGFPQYALSHPTDRVAFATLVIQYGMLTLSAGICLVMLVEAIRGAAGQAPRWTTPAVAGMVGLTLGALLIGLIAQPEGASGAASATAGTEMVHLTASAFAPNIIALHKGDTLTVVGDSPTPHFLANGTWSASNQPQPGAETGAPTINNVQVNDNTMVLGPFSTPGTYHIYCTVHPGMNLTVIVQ
jgi:plastocyanin